MFRQLDHWWVSAVRFLTGHAELLHDVPGTRWDSVLIQGPLQKFGRTAAQVYVEHKAYQRLKAEDGTVYYCVRKTLIWIL